MATITIAQMLESEACAFENGWSEEELLNLAGERLGHAIGRYYTTPGTTIGYLGKGHNAGDTLVALRILRDHYGWKVAYRPSTPPDQCAPLVRKKLSELGDAQSMNDGPPPAETTYPLLLIDGLLGTGANGEIRSPQLELAQEMKHLREEAGAIIAAVDLPSGINADTGESYKSTVKADATFMIGNAKTGLTPSASSNHTGSLVLVDVPPLTHRSPTPVDLICPQTLKFGKSPRPYNFHKGMAGRVSILAGSVQYTGAAALAALGALRGGAGLVTLFVPIQVCNEVTSRCPPEIMVHGYESLTEIQDSRADAYVIGCGLGELDDSQCRDLFETINKLSQPTVLDADALNLISKHNRHDLITQNHVITPHPGEFGRLAPDLANASPEECCTKFTSKSAATLLLKGSRTLIQQSDSPLWMNSTGNPGMATGGQGDLLAGVIGSQLAAGLSPIESAMISAWLCGRAAELAIEVKSRLSSESLTPSDTARHLGHAFRDWKCATR